MYTSLDFSKRLAEVEFDDEPSRYWVDSRLSDGFVLIEKLYEFEDRRLRGENVKIKGSNREFSVYPAYDIINDLCVKYAKEVWGGTATMESIEDWDDITNVGHTIKCTQKILLLLQQGKQDEAERYIEENSILFKTK